MSVSYFLLYYTTTHYSNLQQRNRLGNDKAKESVYIFANAKEIKGEDDEASDEWEYVEESDREVRPRSKNRHTQY